jgi:group I intron endonuclease
MGFIYKITNTVTNKCYIGETVQSNPIRRWNRHINSLTTKKGCPALKDAMKKYGVDKFKFEVLIICFDEDRYKYEREYIKKYNCQVPNGYNILPGGEIGESRLGTKHTPEAIQKMVDSVKRFREANPNYYETYREKHQESIKNINYSECIKNSEKFKKALEEGRIGGGTSEEMKNKIKQSVNEYYKNGGIIKHRVAMTNALGKQIKQFTKDNIFVKNFPSIKEASRETGVTVSNIQHSVSGRAKTAGGYIWKFADEKDLKA